MSARTLLGADGPQAYLELVHRYQPKGAQLTSIEEEEPFTDDLVHRICASLDVANAPFKLAGVFFPPIKALGEAIGKINDIILKFSNQDFMAEFAKRINAKIAALSTEMDKGFDNLEEIITESNFLAEIVSPTRELFAAFTRYTASINEADKKEFFDCYDVRHLGGHTLLDKMFDKLDQEGNKNLLVNVAESSQYAQKNFEKAIKLIGNAMYQLFTAHTFYLMQKFRTPELDTRTEDFIRVFNKMVARLNKLNEWKESAYWKEDFLKKQIEERAKDDPSINAGVKTVCKWLTETYSWDTFLVVAWGDRYTDDSESFFKLKLSEAGNTLQLRLFKDRSTWSAISTGPWNMVIHRFRAKELRDPIDYGKRAKIMEDIVYKLEEHRGDEFNVLEAAKIDKKLGFGLWSFFGKNNFAVNGRHHTDVYYDNSPDAKDEFYYVKTNTGSAGILNRMRVNVLIATY